jgi:hypothetical protein
MLGDRFPEDGADAYRGAATDDHGGIDIVGKGHVASGGKLRHGRRCRFDGQASRKNAGGSTLAFGSGWSRRLVVDLVGFGEVEDAGLDFVFERLAGGEEER